MTGEMAVFCRPVLEAPAFVKRDETVLADAWLPDLVRLGILEAHLGDGVIEKIVANAVLNGRLRPRERRRLLSYPLVIRLVIAMTLLPGSSYRRRCGPGRAARGHPVHPGLAHPHREDGHRMAAADPGGDHGGDLLARRRPLIGDDEPSAVMLAGMPVNAADGMLVNLADTTENRNYFGTTGTGDGSSPFPQARIVALTARAGRAILAAATGKASDGEQTLLKDLARSGRNCSRTGSPSSTGTSPAMT